MNINYRKATLEDKKKLYELGVELNTYNLDHDVKENLFWTGWETDIMSEVEKELKNKNISVYLAETEDEQAVAYITIKRCDFCGHYEVDQLFVHEGYRGQNIGKKLLDMVVSEIKKPGVSLKLEVYKTNEKAISFYKKYGFEETGLILNLDFDNE